METARCKAFLYAAETGSITKAAEELSYTPSGVSQLIQAFENEIGAQLLHRNKRGVTLTEEGKRFLDASLVDAYLGKVDERFGKGRILFLQGGIDFLCFLPIAGKDVIPAVVVLQPVGVDFRLLGLFD